MQKKKIYKVMSKITIASVLAASLVAPSLAQADNGDVRDANGNVYKPTEILLSKSLKEQILLNLNSYTYELGGKAYNYKDIAGLYSQGATDATLAQEIVNKGLVGTPVAATDLSVVSVMAINATGVEVEITALTADLKAATVKVVDNAGKEVAVKEIDLVKGETVATFVFATALTAEPMGTWTVNGVSINLDAIKNIQAFTDANDDIKMNTALTNLGIQNVNKAFLPKYVVAKDALTEPAKTVADVQKVIDDVNAKNMDPADEAKIVNAVFGAQTADNAQLLLEALQNPAFARVNPEWVTTTTNGYMDQIQGTETKVSDIQTAIDTANDLIINAANDAKISTADLLDSDLSVDKEKLTKLNQLISSYATVDKDGVITDTTIKAAPDKIKIQLAVADVLAATTSASLKSKLTALAKLDATNLDMKIYNDTNGKAYVKAIADAAADAKNTTAEIATIITTANTAADTALVAAVNTAATALSADNPTNRIALLKALNALGLQQVAESNMDVYVTNQADLATESDVGKTKADVQVALDGYNIEAIQGATAADALLAALKVIELKDVVDANKDAYLVSVQDTATSGSIGHTDTNTVSLMQTALDGVNVEVVETAQLKAINAATTVAEVQTALDAIVNSKSTEAADYLTIRSVDRDFVAAAVLKERDAVTGPPAKEFANIGDVTTAVSNAVTAHVAALNGVNGLANTTAINDVVTELAKTLDEKFVALFNADKVVAAEAFVAKLTFKEDGTLKTPFVTLADIKALLK